MRPAFRIQRAQQLGTYRGTTMQETLTTKIGNCGNRGRRIWIEGPRLDRAGFHSKRTTYVKTIDNGVITLTVDPTAKTRVSGKGSHPVIDLRSKAIEKLYPIGVVDTVRVEYSPNRITISGA
jgi:hypothetical protein